MIAWASTLSRAVQQVHDCLPSSTQYFTLLCRVQCNSDRQFRPLNSAASDLPSASDPLILLRVICLLLRMDSCCLLPECAPSVRVVITVPVLREWLRRDGSRPVFGSTRDHGTEYKIILCP